MTKEYEKLKALCEIEGCACPEEHIVMREQANTPMWLRIWFRIR